MFVIRNVALADAFTSSVGRPPALGIEQTLSDRWSQDGTLFAVAAEENGTPVGFAVAESHANVVNVLTLEGDTDSCRLLLKNLVEQASEKDVSVWCPLVRIDLREMLNGCGLAPVYEDDSRDSPSCLYFLQRGEAASSFN